MNEAVFLTDVPMLVVQRRIQRRSGLDGLQGQFHQIRVKKLDRFIHTDTQVIPFSNLDTVWCTIEFANILKLTSTLFVKCCVL